MKRKRTDFDKWLARSVAAKCIRDQVKFAKAAFRASYRKGWTDYEKTGGPA